VSTRHPPAYHGHEAPSQDDPDGHGGGGHAHGVTADADRGYLWVALLLLAGFMATEVVVAVLSGSLVLLSDAGHMRIGLC